MEEGASALMKRRMQTRCQVRSLSTEQKINILLTHSASPNTSWHRKLKEYFPPNLDGTTLERAHLFRNYLILWIFGNSACVCVTTDASFSRFFSNSASPAARKEGRGGNGRSSIIKPRWTAERGREKEREERYHESIYIKQRMCLSVCPPVCMSSMDA